MNKEEAVKAFRQKVPVMLMNRSVSERKDLKYDCISAVILRRANTGHEIVQVELMDKNGNSVIITRPEFVYQCGEPEPSYPLDLDEMQKYRCGVHQNVILSESELGKLKKLYPDTYCVVIDEVSEELARGIAYKNHYGAVCRRLQADDN